VIVTFFLSSAAASASPSSFAGLRIEFSCFFASSYHFFIFSLSK